MNMKHLTLILALGMACAGCVASSVTNPTSLPRYAGKRQSALVLADLEREPDVVPEIYASFVAAMARTLREEFSQMGRYEEVVLQRDLVEKPADPGTLYALYRITDFSDALQQNIGPAINAAFFWLVVPIFWHFAIPRAEETVRISAELRIFDISGMKPAEIIDPRTGSRAYSYHTVQLTPLLTQEYEISSVASLGYINAEEKIAFSREFAADLTHKLLAESVEALERAHP